MSKCCWKNGAERLAQHKVALNFQFEKNTVSAKCYKTKCNKGGRPVLLCPLDELIPL